MKEITTLEWSELHLGGADAVSFAQGQFSQVVSSQRQASLLLAPDGHVVAGGQLWGDQDVVIFCVPSSLLEACEKRLRRFLLRVDVTLSECGDTTGPYESPDALFTDRWPSEHEWVLGLPPHSYGQWVVDSAVSFQKGCFTGQELVGRADARGATMPWRFVGGRYTELDAVDASLRAVGPEGPQGVTSYASISGVLHWRGIAHRSWATDNSEHGVEFMA